LSRDRSRRSPAGSAAATAAGNQDRLPGGKDVTWVPTCDAVVARMLDLAQVSAGDTLIDLGSGDGRMVVAAARRGARALGVEYDQDKVALATRNAAAAGVGDKAAFIQADLFQVDLSAATVLTLFLLPALNLRLRPRILDLRPGTRVATNTFDFADWAADQKSEVPPPACTAHCWALCWTVPAKVGGTWRVGDAALRLDQAFQQLSGEYQANGVIVPVTGWLRGDEIALISGGHVLRGQVRGDVIEGAGAWDGARPAWRAVRG
jgi:SAM-dependent methyltransferase